MGTFGERMQREREMRNISLEEIAESTKISTRMLRALEAEDFSKLPGGIFNKGFVRAYAKFLGLDEEQAVADFLTSAAGASPSDDSDDAVANPAGEPFSKAASANGISPAGVSGGEASAAGEEVQLPRQGAGFLAAAVILVIVLGAGGFFFKYYRSGKHSSSGDAYSVASTHPSPAPVLPTQAPPSVAAATEASSGDNPRSSTTSALPGTSNQEMNHPDSVSLAPPDPGTTVHVAALSSATPELEKGIGEMGSRSPNGNVKTVAATKTGPGKLSLQVRTKQESWMRITADGHVIFEGTLTASSSKQFQAAKELVLKLGNAGAVELSYNGKSIPAFAPEIHAKTLTFTAEGLAGE